MLAARPRPCSVTHPTTLPHTVLLSLLVAGCWLLVTLQVQEVVRDGVTVKVLFMDTEGFGAGGNLVTGDPKLAFLATAFSSLLYYNVLESINMVRAAHANLAK